MSKKTKKPAAKLAWATVTAEGQLRHLFESRSAARQGKGLTQTIVQVRVTPV